MHRLRFEDTLLVVYELPLSMEKVSIDDVTSLKSQGMCLIALGFMEAFGLSQTSHRGPFWPVADNGLPLLQRPDVTYRLE